jgi:hypothetical protein
MAKGYSNSGDILTRTRNGQDLNAIWDQYQELLRAFNAARQPLIDLLSFSTTNVIEDIVAPGQETFEEATEFGIPVGIRPAPVPTARAYPFKWWDTRSAYTFQFLAGGPGQAEGASSRQLDTIMEQVLEADNNLQFQQVMKALFNNTARSVTIDNLPYSVTPLFNGDTQFVPTYKGVSFANHQHYIGSGVNANQTAFDPDDHLTLARLVEEHGYNRASGYNVIFLMNPTDANAGIARFVRNQTFAMVPAATTQVVSLYDFIPSQGTNFTVQLPPGFTLVGGLPANSFAGLDVAGSWGPYLVVTDPQIPLGYMTAIATRGQATVTNVVGIREHANASLRGVVLRPGSNGNYPLIDSYFIRGMGTAVGPRGAAAVMQLVQSAAYTAPASMAW